MGWTPKLFNRTLPANAPIALIVAAVAAIELVSQAVPALAAWPQSWVVPLTDWIRDGLTVVLGLLKPIARSISAVLSIVMDGVNSVLTESPWPAIAGVILGVAWWIGRWPLLITALISNGFILASGFWLESMNTFSLVLVSVPLSLALGTLVGIAAYMWPAARRPIETMSDVMQTIPTFAYLVPLLVLFGFGPVVGLIASAIYALPPMARNTLLGLQRVDPEIIEAAIMSGAGRLQRLAFVEVPCALGQIMVGVNQCVMACLAMVIIAAIIGGFDDIGWAVLLTMRKAQFGDSLLAGLVITVFAILIDRLTAGLAEVRNRGTAVQAGAIAGIGILCAIFLTDAVPDVNSLGILSGAADAVDRGLTRFTSAYGSELEGVRNGAMFFGLLPLRIGLDNSVLEFTWGFAWTQAHTLGFWIVTALLAFIAARWRSISAAGAVFIAAYFVLVGVTDVPWLIWFVMAGVLAWRAGGAKLALFVIGALAAILLAGLWDRAMLSLYLCGASVLSCAVFGGILGAVSARYGLLWRLLRPVCDTLQTIPLFVFLIPVLMLFQVGEFTAFLAICAYAVVPSIRYTRHGIATTPDELIESARANGASQRQILFEVRLPYAVPAILLGLNQTILYAFTMLVIAALVGTTGLGQAIYIALGEADLGMGVSAGLAMALLALCSDRILGALTANRKRALGLD